MGVVVVVVVTLEVAVLYIALVVLDVVVVLVAEADDLDHISSVLGHPFDQSFRGMWMFIALRHYQSVLRVSWQILSWPLLSLYISLVRVIVTLIFTVCLIRPCSIADDVGSKVPIGIMRNLTSAISAETVT